jgi:hypothetical protein
MSVFNGGADDLIQWRIEINDLMEPMRGIDGRPTYVRRQPDAELTLFRIDQEECEAVIGILGLETLTFRSGRNAPPLLLTPQCDTAIENAPKLHRPVGHFGEKSLSGFRFGLE